MTLQAKLQRHKLWHDVTITLSILILIAFVGVNLKDHMFASIGEIFDPKPVQEITYKISSGDTLWILASKTTRADEDVRDKIIAIQKCNGLTPTQALIPGQIIKIPMRQVDDPGMRYTFKDNL